MIHNHNNEFNDDDVLSLCKDIAMSNKDCGAAWKRIQDFLGVSSLAMRAGCREGRLQRMYSF